MHLVSDPEIVIDQFGCEQDLHQPTHSDSALPTDPENRVVQPLSFFAHSNLPRLPTQVRTLRSAYMLRTRCRRPTPAADLPRPLAIHTPPPLHHHGAPA